MEAFTLLKYWRGGGGGLPVPPFSDTRAAASTTTTILTAVPQPETENATESDDDDDDDKGPFFDLELTVPEDLEDGHENPNEEEEEEEEEEDDNINVEESDGEREFKLTLSPSSNDRSDVSPLEDIFFNGKLVQVEPESSFSEPNSKPQFTASLLKSATKFRVFMLGLKKPKSSDTGNPEAQNKKQTGDKKHFTVKFKVEEVPIVSLFSRDNSSRGNKTTKDDSSSSEEKRFSKEVMHRYLKMVKPLYIRVSRKYADRLGHLSLSSAGKAPQPAVAPAADGDSSSSSSSAAAAAAADTNVKDQKQGNLPARLRVVCKHLGKSRSASSAVAASPPPFVSSKRRDDSMLQQQDGIQGAILHCKRSFNASRECESSQLPRSVSDPSHEISSELSDKSINEGKDNSSHLQQ